MMRNRKEIDQRTVGNFTAGTNRKDRDKLTSILLKEVPQETSSNKLEFYSPMTGPGPECRANRE